MSDDSMMPQNNEEKIQHQEDAPLQEREELLLPTTTASTTTADAAQRLACTLTKNVDGASLVEIRHLVDTCPEALAVRRSARKERDGGTLMDVIWKRFF
mmetsp:Transcript_22220/g.36790  ORF Transcript_22220/g.36790 Transcript_22220/m.36790 type:complete len:99 (-) Transcript_22220:15-311(-)